MRTLSFSDLKTKADALFRRYLHTLYPAKVKCHTCSKVLPNEHMTIGHAYRRNELPLRYNPLFATLQCGPCNTSGVKDELLKDIFREKYPGWDDIVAQERKRHMDRWELEEVIRILS